MPSGCTTRQIGTLRKRKKMTSPYSRAQRVRKPLQSWPKVSEWRRRFRPRGPGVSFRVGRTAICASAMARTLYAAGLRRSRDDPDRIWREGLQIERKLLRLVRSGNVAQRFGGAQVSKRVLSGSTESMHPLTVGALFVLQIFHVLFLSLHDWIPLGDLHYPSAVRATLPGDKWLPVA